MQAALPSLATNPDGSYRKLNLWTDEWIEARGKIRVLLDYRKVNLWTDERIEVRGKIRVLLGYQAISDEEIACSHSQYKGGRIEAISDEDLRAFKEDPALQGNTRHNELTVTKQESHLFVPSFSLRRRGYERRQRLSSGLRWRDLQADRGVLEDVLVFTVDA
ncbi:hypothetical protein T484DRAFT_1917960, partial [Baffinella frigidus]